MKAMITNSFLLAIISFFSLALFNTGRMRRRNRMERQRADGNIGAFFGTLTSRGWKSLTPGGCGGADIKTILDRYYILAKPGSPALKAISGCRGTICSFPSLFLVTYDMAASARHVGPEEFQGTLAAVAVPNGFTGRTMIIRKPQTSDASDWLSDRPLGAPAYSISAGLAKGFRDEFLIKSTNEEVDLNRHIQYLLIQNKDLFLNSFSGSSALVLDEAGWGFVSTLISEEGRLRRLMEFQEELTRTLAHKDTLKCFATGDSEMK